MSGYPRASPSPIMKPWSEQMTGVERTKTNTCLCGTPDVAVGELLKCETHLKGHTIIGCQICGSAVCKLFFEQEEK